MIVYPYLNKFEPINKISQKKLKLNTILSFLKKNLEIIFFSFIFYGLSFFLIIKEFLIISNYSFLYNFPILELYRFLIIIICFFCFFVGRKLLNTSIFLLILLNLLFLFSSFFGEIIDFTTPAKIFYGLSSSEKIEDFFFQKNKIILINTLNVILPLISILFLKNSIDKLNRFRELSVKICDIFLILLVLLLSYKYFSFVIVNLVSIETILINLHSSMYFLNIYFIILSDKILKKNEINIFIVLRILLIFYCFFIAESILHPLICLLTFVIYFIYSKKNKYILISFLVFFFIIFISNSFKLSFFDSELIKNHWDNYDTFSGTIMYSLLVRFEHIEYFIFLSNNHNFLLGNSIFTDNAYTYPHNLLIDIFITTGVIGLIIFTYIILNLAVVIKKYVNSDNLFIILIFFQSFVFSFFSGFLFTNIIFNISLAACFCFLKPKHSIIL